MKKSKMVGACLASVLLLIGFFQSIGISAASDADYALDEVIVCFEQYLTNTMHALMAKGGTH